MLFRSPLYRFVRRYVGDADDAYDILQDAFVSAWLALRRFDSNLSVGAWLRAIALNKCRDHSRRRAVRRRALALFATESTSARLPGIESIAGAEPPESRYLRQLDEAIATLPRRYKEPLLLTLIAGLTHRQAAEQLGTTAKAVEMRVRRAKKRLSETLSEAYRADSGWEELFDH